MSPPTERTGPLQEAGPTNHDAIVPAFPRGGDPRRRLRLHHRLVRMRRWSRELDELCGLRPTRRWYR